MDDSQTLQPTVVYLAGLAHTGSTFFSRVLNQHDAVFAAGEMVNVGEEFERLHNGRGDVSCACGRRPESTSSCSFWPELFTRLRERDVDPLRIARVSHQRQLEWIRACLNRYPSGGQAAFRSGNIQLYNLLADTSGSQVVVDSSKTLWRLLPLARCLQEPNFRILHLVKTPAHQMESRLRRGYNFWHSALLKYLRKNGLIKGLFGESSSYRKIVFEDFVENPRSTLRHLFQWLNLPDLNPFDRPQQPTHHLRGHLDAYRPHSPEKELEPPDPQRLKQNDVTFTAPQRQCLRLLDGLFT